MDSSDSEVSMNEEEEAFGLELVRIVKEINLRAGGIIRTNVPLPSMFVEGLPNVITDKAFHYLQGEKLEDLTTGPCTANCVLDRMNDA